MLTMRVRSFLLVSTLAVLSACGGTGSRASTPRVTPASATAPSSSSFADNVALTYNTHDKKTGTDDSITVARRGPDMRYAGPGFVVITKGGQRITCQEGKCKTDAFVVKIDQGMDVALGSWFDPWGPHAAFGIASDPPKNMPGQTIAGVKSECQSKTITNSSVISCRALSGHFHTLYEDPSIRQELRSVRSIKDSDFER